MERHRPAGSPNQVQSSVIISISPRRWRRWTVGDGTGREVGHCRTNLSGCVAGKKIDLRPVGLRVDYPHGYSFN